MSEFCNSFPRALDFQQFLAEPLEFLTQARRMHGDLFLIREREAVFSRLTNCAGVVVAFGTNYQRSILTDIELFGMPTSAAQLLRLPQRLINLNRGLHSMGGDQHASQKRLLMGMLNSNAVDLHLKSAWKVVNDFAAELGAVKPLRLLAHMRQLMLLISSRSLFGDQHDENSRLVLLMQNYFHLRREASSPGKYPSQEAREHLEAVGSVVDFELRNYIRQCRESGSGSISGILGQLANPKIQSEISLTEDEIVGHSNILFVSSTEPLAVALTWILLILSQMPNLRSNLRKEVGKVLDNYSRAPTTNQLSTLTLLDCVVNETMRLLPPNAFMTRITTRPTSLSGFELPKDSEIVLCPLVAHRDSTRFENPKDFFLDRWKGPPPSPFDYFPFGAGGHSCVGKNLAISIIKAVLVSLIPRYEITLRQDQEVDWQVHIMFMPQCDPIVTFHPVGAPIEHPPGKLKGPIGKLLDLGSNYSAC